MACLLMERIQGAGVAALPLAFGAPVAAAGSRKGSPDVRGMCPDVRAVVAELRESESGVDSEPLQAASGLQLTVVVRCACGQMGRRSEAAAVVNPRNGTLRAEGERAIVAGATERTSGGGLLKLQSAGWRAFSMPAGVGWLAQQVADASGDGCRSEGGKGPPRSGAGSDEGRGVVKELDRNSGQGGDAG